MSVLQHVTNTSQQTNRQTQANRPWLMSMFWFIGCRSCSSFGMWQNLNIIILIIIIIIIITTTIIIITAVLLILTLGTTYRMLSSWQNHCELQEFMQLRTQTSAEMGKSRHVVIHDVAVSAHFGARLGAKQCTVRQYTTLIYPINLLWKLVLGLGLDSRVALF